MQIKDKNSCTTSKGVGGGGGGQLKIIHGVFFKPPEAYSQCWIKLKNKHFFLLLLVDFNCHSFSVNIIFRISEI